MNQTKPKSAASKRVSAALRRETDTKRCRICRQELPRSQFNYNNRDNTRCYECSLEIAEEYRRNSKGAAKRVSDRKRQQSAVAAQNAASQAKKDAESPKEVKVAQKSSASKHKANLSEAERVLDASTFTKYLGLQVEELGDGFCRTRLPVRPEHLNQGGIVHGGLYGVVADHTAGTAASSTVPEGMRVLTSEYKINLLRPGKCQALVTEGRVIKTGQRLIIGEATVFGEVGGQRVELAVALFTFAVVGKPQKLERRKN